MRSTLLVAHPADIDPVHQRIEGLEDLSITFLDQHLEDPTSPRSVSSLAALIKGDLQRRFDLGERPRVAEYLERFPLLSQSKDRVVSLVYEEFCLLQECGENPDSEEFCEAYGPWRDSLLSQLAYHRDLSLAVSAVSSRTRVKFPSVGDQFDKYMLRSVLGEGGVARVYLATEDDLGGRRLAIKVSASFGQEPSILGKLDHQNIVPILTVARSESGLRGICMPYRPGVTLEGLIERMGRGTPPRQAQDFWKCLEPRDEDSPLPPDAQRTGWVGFPLKGKLPEAVAWVGLSLSNALTYLHGQGVYHRDIKPANVLLAYKEGPQLLDFNLAQDPQAPDQVNAALKGGTLPYMAPEQLRAFINASAWDSVGPGADIYSLGLILREILTGRPPEVPTPKTSLSLGIQGLLDRRAEPLIPTREINPSVPPALDSIIAKCLAFDSSDRYQSASELAEDLQRFLDRKPLAHTPNRSKLEWAANWMIRNRRLAAAIPFLLGFATLIPSLRAPSRIPDKLEVSKIVRIPDEPEVRKIVRIPEMPEFRRAVSNLHSDRLEDWKVAKDSFETFRRDFPQSAYPPLYLELAIEKLDDTNIKISEDISKTLDDLIKYACKQSDAEEAIKESLRDDPRSSVLLTAQGWRLCDAKKYELARKPLSMALEISPERIMTLLTLAEVERKLGRFEESIDYFMRAIAAEIRVNFGWQTIYLQRNLILSNYGRLAEKLMEQGESSDTRKQLVRTLVGLEDNLKVMEEMLGAAQLDGLLTLKHRYNQQFYRGILASCRVELSADSQDLSMVRRHYDEALQEFDKAGETLKSGLAKALGPKGGASYREQLDHQIQKLRKRASKYLPANKGEPPTSVGGE